MEKITFFNKITGNIQGYKEKNKDAAQVKNWENPEILQLIYGDNSSSNINYA